MEPISPTAPARESRGGTRPAGTAADRDALGRRKRIEPVPTGKRVTPQPRDLLWFEKLRLHGPLPTSFLLAFAEGVGRSEKRARERLTDLFNEDNTPDGGRYLDRPPQQFRTIDSRYNQLVHDLAPAGERALARAGRPARPPASGPWVHRLMVSCVTASIELGTLTRDDLVFIPGERVIERAGTELRHPVSIPDLVTGRPVTRTLIPDALFGLEYRTRDGSRYRFFVVECDRATEPMRAATFNRKSWIRSLRQYQAYVGAGLYREHLKLTAPLLVLNVITDQVRLEKMIAVAGEELGGSACCLFPPWPAFGTVWRPPSPELGLLSSEWQRPARMPFRIDRV